MASVKSRGGFFLNDVKGRRVREGRSFSFRGTSEGLMGSCACVCGVSEVFD